MAGCTFELVRDMPVVSDYHQVEVDQFQTPAPPSIGLLHDRVATRDWCVHGHCHRIGLHIHFVHFKEIA